MIINCISVNKRNYLIIGLFCLGVISNQAAYVSEAVVAVSAPDSLISSRISSLIANEQYDMALRVADSVSASTSESPFGQVLNLIILNSRGIDYEDNLDDEAVRAACQKVKELSNRQLENVDESACLWFYIGTADMFMSIVETRNGSLYNALVNVLRAGNSFRKAVSLDSTCWDAYYGRGCYRYYLSSRAGLLRNIGLVSDHRDQGVEDIEIAAKNGVLTRLAAKNSLAWIAMEQGDYPLAIKLAKELCAEYPGRRAFLWCLGKALKHEGQWEEALAVYTELLESVRGEERNNHYNEIGCLHSIALAHSELGNWSDVVRISDAAVEITLSREVSKKKRDDVKKLTEMRKKALKQINAR